MTLKIQPKTFYVLALVAITFFIFFNASIIDGDFDMFYQAARLFMQRFNPYAPAAYTAIGAYGFVYLPIAIFMVLPCALLPLGFSMLAWTYVTYLMFAASIYLWHQVITQRPPTLKEFVLLTIASCTAPVIWSFFFHQLTIPLLFFSALSLCLMRQERFFGSGIAAGCLLIKPHLALPFLLLIGVRAAKKPHFWLGFALCAALPFLPFVTKYRPAKDLIQLKQSLYDHGVNLYTLESQGIPSKLYRGLLMSHQNRQDINHVNPRNKTNIMLSVHAMQKWTAFNRHAFGVFLLLFFAYLLWSRDHLARPEQAVIALFIGVLFSNYSHCYDACLIVPLGILAIHKQSVLSLQGIASLLFFSGMLYAYVIPISWTASPHVYWERTSYVSLFYGLIFGGLYATQKMNLEA